MSYTAQHGGSLWLGVGHALCPCHKQVPEGAAQLDWRRRERLKSLDSSSSS